MKINEVCCIFCGSKGPSSAISHIVPESLGGPHSPIATQGITCNKCNQYFGQKVEQPALRSFPYSAYRLFSSVPSKKGRPFEMPVWQGTVQGTGMPGQFFIRPATDAIRETLQKNKTGQLRILAEVSEPLAVCRMLIKIGLEQIASNAYEMAVSDRLHAAREFCRRPKHGDRWWFLLFADPIIMQSRLSKPEEDFCQIEVTEQQGQLCAILRLAGILTIVPLESNLLPPSDLGEKLPKCRAIWAAS
ncbi:HNH endonuclease [Rhodoferax saidenbachensis]|uniref:HNH endonuclease 5 domain-containing protein n=1 Tax=Rhodoferax saidenbachensis TaxID=1484693 RepID=A0A1P8KAD6_9BURK|nr:HNH endonuclease [Rhodoferax saidenbachensis]APW42935.1 hypothetical protein RS694_10580 [Rhodoferax saidenbachensis]